MTVWSTLSPKDVLSVIPGGGAGTRLFPLTQDRAKPAVPLGGKYRIVDIPISNCLNADLRRICLLTQFNSSSLHRHIQESYRFDSFSHGFVEILAAACPHWQFQPMSGGPMAPLTPPAVVYPLVRRFRDAA